MKSKIWSMLLSLAIAFGLWVYVITVVSPGSDTTISGIPVVFEGESYLLDERNLMITSNKDMTVSLRLSGNRSDLVKVDKSNITIKVDLTKVYEAGNQQLTYSISYPSDVPNGAFNVESQYPQYLPVTVETRQSKDVEVRVNFSGAVPEDFLADTENKVLDYPKVNVKGPSSVVELIDHARIDVSLEDRNTSINESFRYILCDAEGNPVDVEMVTTDVAEVHLEVPIKRFKEITLKMNVKYGGGALDTNTRVEIIPATIKVSGSEAQLEKLEEIVLEDIDLSTIEEDTTLSLPIKLPDEVTNLSEITEATVNITFVGLSIKEFTVDDIKAINVPEGMEADLMNQVMKVRLRGLTSLINSIGPEDILVTVDFADKELGSYTIKPSIAVMGDDFATVGAVGSYSVSVTLREAPEEEE